MKKIIASLLLGLCFLNFCAQDITRKKDIVILKNQTDTTYLTKQYLFENGADDYAYIMISLRNDSVFFELNNSSTVHYKNVDFIQEKSVLRIMLNNTETVTLNPTYISEVMRYDNTSYISVSYYVSPFVVDRIINNNMSFLSLYLTSIKDENVIIEFVFEEKTSELFSKKLKQIISYKKR